MKLKKLLRVLSAWTAAAIAAGSIAVSSAAAADEADTALGSLGSVSSVSSTAAATNIAQQDEVNAVWIAFFDLQTALKGQDKAGFTANVRQMYQNCADSGLNTVIVQVRPYGDSFYPSEYFPWSSYCYGAIGTDPGFDPLEILVTEAHRQGLTIEAWVNPLRLVSEKEITEVSPSYPVRKWYENAEKKSENLISYGGRLYLNPASEEARQLICDGVTEIIEGYDVDGIHIDDYFYPSGLPMEYDAASYQASRSSLSQADWRRENINELVSEMYSAVKKADSDCVFGISPRGVVSQDYNLVYADVEYWASHEGYCDYLAPQIYYGFEHSTADYAKTIRQWSEMTTAKGVSLRIGLAAYKAGNTDRYAGNGANEWVENNNIIARQINLSRQYDNVEGLILFDYKQIFSEPNDAMKIEKKNFTALLK
ncbi:MAG: family 10 glycosylhydrolase [Candidatus Faecivivens sp.]|nr:family 10 glycosylhydrolase [Oscillospiraceae bacterium]MDY2713262.1 family 10 glycosylhydrolase [Candidatus Faecivivens sp.]